MGQLHLHEPTPRVDWSGLNLEVVREGRAWRRAERRRVAGVSSFGLSGVNAHVLLAEAPLQAQAQDARERSQAPAQGAGAAQLVEKFGDEYFVFFDACADPKVSVRACTCACPSNFSGRVISRSRFMNRGTWSCKGPPRTRPCSGTRIAGRAINVP